MSLTNIKNRLQDDFAAITGVRKAYDDTPKLSVTETDCPAVIMARRDPFVNVKGDASDAIRYTYQFDILFLLCPIALYDEEYWDSAIEPYPQRFTEALCADYSGGGAWTYWNKDDDTAKFTIRPLQYKGKYYFGFRWSLDIFEIVTTTMNPGA